jgi:aspartate/methionine/tyrosine aminotransferase
MGSPYMEFAKLRSPAKYNLATSGIAIYSLAELPVRLQDLEITGPDVYGCAPLLERLSRYTGTPVECIVTAAGTSFANHLAMAATFDPGDEVLIEYPTYELLVSTAKLLGAEVRFFHRRMEDAFRVDPAEVERQITSRTRLIVLTNLHNPSGAYIAPETLRQVGDIAKGHGARVLVDEVYLELFYGERPPTALALGDHFLVTSSLTKAFGLSGLRCGWILASPDLAHRMWRLDDLYAASPVYVAQLLSVVALDHLERIAARASHLLNTNRHAFQELLGSSDAIEYVWPDHGTVVLPRLKRGTVQGLDRLLRDKYDTSVVPGQYFYLPEHFRVGLGGDTEMTREGLIRLRQALEEAA